MISAGSQVTGKGTGVKDPTTLLKDESFFPENQFGECEVVALLHNKLPFQTFSFQPCFV